MSSNFVDIVGFQLEKVHTGMIQWMLEADPKIVSDADKCKIMNELTGKNSNFIPLIYLAGFVSICNLTPGKIVTDNT